ncbi:HesB/IscA family protein [Caldimonas tepidiphila]|uniref:HesB/IscA family protein n=1 Tax=Caldimonas tepidiphila TaxID=2315841 RepID=UPI000E5AAE67|nr:iron-sulfur cluster assembly accessory protein [Caldimonas tepidiphila]
MLPNLTITPAADRFMRRFVRFSGLPEGAGLRLTVAAGGCSGYTSELSVEAGPRAGDETLVHEGLRIFLPADSRLLLEGVTIDFAETATSAGLSFLNPNAGACACGSSGASSAPPGLAKIDIASIRPAATLAS